MVVVQEQESAHTLAFRISRLQGVSAGMGFGTVKHPGPKGQLQDH